MILNCDLKGNVVSIPSSVPLGTILEDVLILAPHTCSMVILKVKPPYQEYLEDIPCHPVITVDENGKNIIVFKANLPRSVTLTAGRTDYQILQTDSAGKAVATYMGTFNVARGVISNMPGSVEELEGKTISEFYSLLSDVSLVQTMLKTIEDLLGYPSVKLQNGETIIGAVNSLAEDVASNTESIGYGNIVDPPEFLLNESGLTKLANTAYRLIKNHSNELANAPYGTVDPHNTRKAIEESVYNHNGNNEAHPHILKEIASNETRIKKSEQDISGLQYLGVEVEKAIDEIFDDIEGNGNRIATNKSNITKIQTHLVSLDAQLQGVGRSYAIDNFNDFVAFMKGAYRIPIREDRNGDGVDETYYLSASDLKTGDNVLLAELNVPDFWFEKTAIATEKTYTYDGEEYSLNAYNGADVIGVFHILETDYQVIATAAMSATKSAEEAAESAGDAEMFRNETKAFAESIFLKQVAPPISQLQNAIVLPSATLAQIGG